LYLFREREIVRKRESMSGGWGGRGEADYPTSGEPDVGLDPRTLGS